MLLCGDAEYVVDLFQDPVSCLHGASFLSGVDREASVNEFKSLVVDLRQRSSDPKQICDVFKFLEASVIYQCRGYVKQVMRLLRVMVCPGPSAMPPVDISSSGVGFPATVIRSGISAVQSFVLHPKFVSNDLLTVECLEELKMNLPVGHQFLARTSFDPFVDISRHAWTEVFESLFRCYTAYYTGQVDGWRSRMAGGRSSRGVPSGATSAAETVSVVEASEPVQASTSSSAKEENGVEERISSREILLNYLKLHVDELL